MLFFYQVKNLTLKFVQLTEESCPQCSKKGGLTLYFDQRYLSALVPLIPAGKYGELECIQCNTVIPVKKWPASVKNFYKEEKKSLKTPGRLWTGIAVLSLIAFALIAYPVYLAKSANKKSANQELLLASLKPGDILRTLAHEEHVSESAPTFYKIARVIDDTAFLQRYNQNWPLQDIKQWEKIIPDPGNFNPAELPFSFSAIKLRKDLISLGNNEKFKISSGTILEIITSR